MSNIKYPHVTVELIGEDSNAFAILGRVSRAMKKAKIPQIEIDEFLTEATNGSYEHLLVTVMNTVSVNTDDYDDYDDYQLWGEEE